jgi:enoyl-CoA hydratase/carnithine racemase
MPRKPRFRRLLYATRDRVATVTLNRPEVLNALDSTGHREVQAAIDEAEGDDAVRVIVLTGAGRAFCSGSDIRHVRDFRGADARRYVKLDFSTKNRVATCSKPVIAALHGHVAGGGFELALACDMRFVADNVVFSLPEIVLGTIPGSGGLQRLPQVVGLGIAKEWALTGRRIDAEEAFRTGLANGVFALDELMPRTLALARELAERSAIALALAKVALDPAPPAPAGLIGTYHTLASQACRDDPTYGNQAGDFVKKKKKMIA